MMNSSLLCLSDHDLTRLWMHVSNLRLILDRADCQSGQPVVNGAFAETLFDIEQSAREVLSDRVIARSTRREAVST